MHMYVHIWQIFICMNLNALTCIYICISTFTYIYRYIQIHIYMYIEESKYNISNTQRMFVHKSWAATISQHQYQRAHSTNTNKTQHKHQKVLFEDHVLPPLQSISTKEYTASIPASTQRQYLQRIVLQKSWATTTSQHQCQREHSINTNKYTA